MRDLQSPWEKCTESLKLFKSSSLGKDVNVHFIDVFYDGLDEYREIISAMNKGLSQPLASIDGELTFF